MNAQIGKDEINKFCWHNSSSRKEEYRTPFSLENSPTLPQSTDRLYTNKQEMDK